MNKMTNPGELLAKNLKAFNAKERDHFMRFAYLGQVEPYQHSRTFLSKPFLDALWKNLGNDAGFPETGECLFAGMDYHLDWLFAALHCTAEGNYAEKVVDEKPKERSDASDPMKLHLISGNQEDVDLLALLRANDRLVLIFVEAKGDAAFDRMQLTRKLIRVSNAIRESKITGCEFRYVLASPSDPTQTRKSGSKPSTYLELTTPKSGCDFHSRLTDLLNDGGPGFNDEIAWIGINGFPEKDNLMKAQRCGENHSHWKVSKR